MVHMACRRRQTANIYKRMYLPDCFHPFPFPNARLARCVYVSVCELLLEGLCVISFRQETGNGVEAITLGESPRAPRNEGQGPVSTHRCVCACVCVQAGSSR